jgi:glyoxylase-like metal-dependent hydrolase (beta-lactamase superfamily II)
MLLRPFLYNPTACASYLFGCGTHAKLAVVDPHAELVDDYLATTAALGAPIVAVFETHVQADHVSGLPALVERSGATGRPEPRPRGTPSCRSRTTSPNRRSSKTGPIRTGRG